MKTFVYSPEAKKRGMGAEKGFHDDRIIALMLAYHEVKAQKSKDDEDLIIAQNEKTEIKSGSGIWLKDILGKMGQKHWLEH